MIMKKIAIIIFTVGLLLCGYDSYAQVADSLEVMTLSGESEKTKAPTKKLRLPEAKSVDMFIDTLTNEYLDTIKIHKKLELNDYSMIGVQYGAALSSVMWNPSQKQNMLFMPVNFGVMFTKYGKMFGYMPYFGFQAGVFYGKEGYQFKYNEDDDYTYTIEGAEKAVMEVIEVPVLAHMHVDFWKMKLIANLGCYGGYRMSIERFPGKTGNVSEELAHSFKETDHRFDYGLKGGFGVAFIFDPLEVHITGMYKYSFSTLYDPDYYNAYYYRYAYPSNIIISAGLHFHLSKRTGQTKSQLKKMAKDLVYGENID